MDIFAIYYDSLSGDRCVQLSVAVAPARRFTMCARTPPLDDIEAAVQWADKHGYPDVLAQETEQPTTDHANATLDAAHKRIASLEENARRADEQIERLAEALYSIAELPFGTHVDDAPYEPSYGDRTAKVARSTVEALHQRFVATSATLEGFAARLAEMAGTDPADGVECALDSLQARLARIEAQRDAACEAQEELCAAIAPGDFVGSVTEHCDRAQDLRMAAGPNAALNPYYRSVLKSGNKWDG